MTAAGATRNELANDRNWLFRGILTGTSKVRSSLNSGLQRSKFRRGAALWSDLPRNPDLSGKAATRPRATPGRHSCRRYETEGDPIGPILRICLEMSRFGHIRRLLGLAVAIGAATVTSFVVAARPYPFER